MDQVTLAKHGDLFCIPCGNGFTCLGFDVCIEWTARRANALNRLDLLPKAPRGSLESYAEYETVTRLMRESGKRFDCDLSPQLVGLERKRVEVIDKRGEKRRFIVGKSMGFVPIHLEIKTRRSLGGMAADHEYRSVRVLP